MTKQIEYEALRADVRRVFLEGAIADSGVIPVGSNVQYNEYDEVQVQSTGSEYTLVF